MKNFTGILKTMFAVFFILQIIFYAKVYANNVDGTKLDGYLDNLQRNNHSMLSVSVSERGNSVYLKSVGFTDPSFTNVSNVNTKYRIGELSKTFTSIMVMQMVEEKMIQLGTPISRFFPEIPNGKHISIKDLLSERINMSNYLPGGKNYKLIKSDYVFDEILKESSQTSIENEYSFNNPNYQLLALILEKVSAKSYKQLLKERITDRIGLSNTFNGNEDLNSEACAFNFENGEWEVVANWDLSSVQGAASILSTPKDLAKLMDALFHEKLVNAKSLKSMLAINNNKGLGLEEIRFGNRVGYGYTGEINGVVSQMIYFPMDGICISFSMNSKGVNTDNIMLDLVKIIYGS